MKTDTYLVRWEYGLVSFPGSSIDQYFRYESRHFPESGFASRLLLNPDTILIQTKVFYIFIFYDQKPLLYAYVFLTPLLKTFKLQKPPSQHGFFIFSPFWGEHFGLPGSWIHWPICILRATRLNEAITYTKISQGLTDPRLDVSGYSARPPVTPPPPRPGGGRRRLDGGFSPRDWTSPQYVRPPA
jgi:hypothetical protein